MTDRPTDAVAGTSAVTDPGTSAVTDLDPVAPLARVVVARMTALGTTLAVAESLTGGQLSAAVVDVPGASNVLRGGVVAYATELKHHLLGVDAGLLARVGAVDGEVAVAMAAGVAERLGAAYGLATTGVAGPDPQDGKPVGTVHVAVVGPDVVRAEQHLFTGDRAAIRQATTAAALRLLLAAIGPESDGAPRTGPTRT